MSLAAHKQTNNCYKQPNRDDRERGIAALPAYVAASTDMLCFETPDYGDRAWCRLERAVAFAFMFSGVCCSPPAATNLAHAVCASCTRRVFLLSAHNLLLDEHLPVRNYKCNVLCDVISLRRSIFSR
jgi:hypothetical protein